jgi:lysozyme
MSNTEFHEQALRDPRVRAFLDTIARSEGANYNTVVGGGTFSDFSRHPNRGVTLTIKGKRVQSHAAGRYQFMPKTWNPIQQKFGLPDFSPHSQDLAAVELLKQKGALTPLLNNKFRSAVTAVAPVWASFPGANYNQHEQSFAFLLKIYNAALGKAGGMVAEGKESVVDVVKDNSSTLSDGGKIVALVVVAVLIGKVLG